MQRRAFTFNDGTAMELLVECAVGMATIPEVRENPRFALKAA